MNDQRKDESGKTSQTSGSQSSMSASVKWIRSVLSHWAKTLLGLRRYNAKRFFTMMSFSLGVVAFLLAAKYFTAKPSVDLSVTSISRFYNLPLLIQFYRDQDIEPPEIFHDKKIAHLFSDTLEYPNLSNYINSGTSDLGILQKIKNGSDMGGFLSERITDLERHLDDSTYERHFYMSPDWGSHYPEESIQELTEYVKIKSSREEYYTFLMALISGRITHSMIFVKNDGVVNLKDIAITIPAPVSKLTETREGNIVYSEVIGNSLNDVERKADRIIWHISFLSSGEHLALNVTTKDTEIVESDLFYTYVSDQRLEYWDIAVTFMFVFVAVFIVGFWFRGRQFYE